MSYVFIHRKRDGSTEITRTHDDGRKELLAQEPPPGCPRGHLSTSNGIVGGPAAKRIHEKLDAELGIRDCVEYVPIGHGAYKAKYEDIHNFDRWMRGRRRVNHDAGYGTPAPGDFAGKV